jgi:nucleoside-diphosphate-sugar epimerase
MNVLVTGGTGAVGANIVRALAAAGHDVVCVSRGADAADAALGRFLAPVASRVRIAAADVGDPASVDRLWAEHRPTHVVHAAAITPTPDMERRLGPAVLQVNVMGTVHILDAARRWAARRVVYVSSGAVYGESDEAVPVDETSAVKPWGLYGIAKDASERLCGYWGHLHGLDAVSLRVGWVYGPMERPMPGSRLTMSLVHACVRLALAGDEIRLAHLHPVRDWIHADDVGRAVMAVLERPTLAHRVYNVAGPEGYSHWALLDALSRAVPVRYRQVAEHEANVPPALTRSRRGPLAVARLMSDTGYRPRYALEDGLRQYVEWARSGDG